MVALNAGSSRRRDSAGREAEAQWKSGSAFYNCLEIKTMCSARVNKGFATQYIVNVGQCLVSDGERRLFSVYAARTTIEEKRLARDYSAADRARSLLPRMRQANG